MMCAILWIFDQCTHTQKKKKYNNTFSSRNVSSEMIQKRVYQLVNGTVKTKVGQKSSSISLFPFFMDKTMFYKIYLRPIKSSLMSISICFISRLYAA